MIRSAIFMAYILLTISGYSQYHRFIDENKRWVEFYIYTDLLDIVPGSYSVFFSYFKGDTVINEKTYNKMYVQDFYLDTWYTPTHIIDDTLYSPQLYALLREDTLAKQVFDINEQLLYDFSLDVGDTLNNYIGVPFIIDSIVSIQLNYGDIRKKFYVSYFDSHEESYYIEGIGGENGILEPFYMPLLSGFQTSGGIICYEENSIQLYGTCDYPNYVVVGLNTSQNKELSYYPNPVIDKILIDLRSFYSSIKISIIDLNGKTVKETIYSNASLCQLDLSGFDKGIFIMKIQLDNDQCQTIKIIKN